VKEMTAGELAAALGEDPDAVVELRILDAGGGVLVDDVMQLAVGHGTDFDRSGGYRWVVITGQVEPRTLGST
jgi:hypothetical protein